MGNEILMSPGKSNSRGCLILFSGNFGYEVLRSKVDLKGNIVATEIKIQQMYTFTLINIYGPNRDKPDFYKVIRGIINDFSSDFVIISEDFNLILNPNIDCENYRNVNNPNARNEVLSMQNDFKLVDVWRVQNEDKCRFTRFSNTPLKRARLDFFLVSEELSSLIVKTDIHPGYRTDHALVEIEFKLNDHRKGRGLWTFNN